MNIKNSLLRARAEVHTADSFSRALAEHALTLATEPGKMTEPEPSSVGEQTRGGARIKFMFPVNLRLTLGDDDDDGHDHEPGVRTICIRLGGTGRVLLCVDMPTIRANG